MLAFDCIAEQRIQEAVDAGKLDNLPGAGKPLRLDDNSLVPEELRAAHRIMKNAGVLPQAMALRAGIVDLERQLERMSDGHERGRACRRLALLRMRLEAQRRPGARISRAGARHERMLIGAPGGG